MSNLDRVRKNFLQAVGCALVAITAFITATAQNPGDKVEYKAQNWPEKWETGTFVKALPGGTQALIREKPTEFFPQGFERAYALKEIRQVGNNQTDQVDLDKIIVKKPETADGPMSEQNVLTFLRNRLGEGDPFRDNPKRELALKALREEVLRRGVNFRYASVGDFSNQLMKFGALSNVTAPLTENFGPPAKLASIFDQWRLSKVGDPNNPRFGNAGSLNINSNDSYVWNSPSGVIKGKWRKATPDEMAKSDKGGDGIVLLNAKSGLDWLVFKRNEGGPQGEGVKITDLGTRNMRERGTR